MNKRGLTSFIFGFIGLAILLLILVSLISVNEGVETEKVVSSLENVHNEEEWKSRIDNSDSIITNVVYKFCDFILYTSEKVSQEAVIWGAERNIKPKLILWVIVISLLAPIIFPLFKILIALILITKEFYEGRRERKRLNYLRRKNDTQS